MIMLKAITPEIHPQPNHSRHEWGVPQCATSTLPIPTIWLYSEYAANALPMHPPTCGASDGLQAFEIIDNNGSASR